MAEKAYEVYASKYGTGQSLERLAERGGFGVVEIIWLLSGGSESHQYAGNNWLSDHDGQFPPEKDE